MGLWPVFLFVTEFADTGPFIGAFQPDREPEGLYSLGCKNALFYREAKLQPVRTKNSPGIAVCLFISGGKRFLKQRD